ncbi:MAG TPA: nucleoside-diphosphate sugar epimerase/dehydratase [Gammaproteobacteria bacterium]
MHSWIKRQLAGMVELSHTLHDRLMDLPRNTRQMLLLSLDSLFVPLSLWGAWLLSVGRGLESINAMHLLAAGTVVLSSEYIFLRLGLYRAVIRYMGHQAIVAIVKGISLSTVVAGIAAWAFVGIASPLFLFLYGCLSFLLIGGSRLVVRAWSHYQVARAADSVIIYGAGSAGRQLLTALTQGDEYRAVCFVDDDRALQGSVIHGVLVRSPNDIADIVREFSVSQVLLALPATGRKRRREIINQLINLPVYVRTIPAFADLVRGDQDVQDIQDIDLEDLLGRDPVMPREDLMKSCIENRSVLVTGAGGSIGSELCRQIVEVGPRRLVMVEQSEYALYQIERELEDVLRQSGRSIELVPLLASVRDYKHMRRIFEAFGVETIYHAAAYKHVPMVEFNAVEGVHNNVFGTYESARAAIDAGVDIFVLVSTDKAVRPANVMGASKRLAEGLLQALSTTQSVTRFCMVRFGNVLGSSGSVVPLFREQIQTGGPVTVTHKDIIRYFMTASEAAQLVLQAGAMARGGDVFVLNMGEPIRIYDLACRMIRLMGYEVKVPGRLSGDIEIKITGLRPGEKLYEELVLGENVTGTGHPMIMRAHEQFLEADELFALLEVLRTACEAYDCEGVSSVLHAACGVRGAPMRSDRVWNVMQSVGHDAHPGDANVTALFPRNRK